MARGFRMSAPMRDDTFILTGYRIFCKNVVASIEKRMRMVKAKLE